MRFSVALFRLAMRKAVIVCGVDFGLTYFRDLMTNVKGLGYVYSLGRLADTDSIYNQNPVLSSINTRIVLLGSNAPLTDETRGMFDEDVFERMDGDSVLVNTARGGIVESDALIHALETNQIAGAALDVLPEEPPPIDSVLRELENVVVTPHVAWYSEDSILELRRTLTKDVLRVLEGGGGNNVVNDVEPGTGRR